MKNYKFLIVFIIISSINTFSQNTSEILFGFKLLQYVDCLQNNFGEPYKTFTDSSSDVTFNVYLLENDLSSYLVFGIYEEQIQSIQLFSLSENVSPEFKKLKMGSNKELTIQVLGTPNKIEPNEIGGEVLYFNDSNFSVEINESKLSSIKIWNNQSLYQKPSLEQLPTVEDVKNILKSGNNKVISKLVSSSIEIWDENGEINFLKFPWEKEILYDYSNIYSQITDFFWKIKDTPYTEDIRLMPGENPLLVYKFEKNDKVLELVFRNEFGKYLIWEIRN